MILTHLWPWNKVKPQGHQTWYELIGPKQGYMDANFEKSHLNSVKKPTINFLSNQKTSQSPPLDTCDSRK